MTMWGRVFAGMYDHAMARSERAGLAARRSELLARAGGEVLEIGGGTGANLPLYGGEVASLVVTEPEAPMVARLRRRIAAERPSATVLQASAEELPFEDESFDVAVSTLVLCTVGDQPRALGELRRVLRPGGRLLFMEHVRAEDPRLARWQDRMVPLNRRLLCGCHCNRRTLEGITEAGFRIAEVERGEIPHAPPLVRPLVVGVAEPTVG
jgi:ubiquinone/menaquinone biosynthesis C-methylase UbiE